MATNTCGGGGHWGSLYWERGSGFCLQQTRVQPPRLDKLDLHQSSSLSCLSLRVSSCREERRQECPQECREHSMQLWTKVSAQHLSEQACMVATNPSN